MIFTHEITHYLQGDMLLKWCVLLLHMVHFFNSLAWVLRREVQKWSKYACDIRACSAIGGAKEYFQVIADMALFSPEGSLAAHLTESKNELAERIERVKNSILKNQSTSSISIQINLQTAALICHWLCFYTKRQRKPQPQAS